MPGRFVYWMNVSADLKIEHAANELGDGSWMRITESLHRVFNERARALSLGVEGRIIYEAMENYWPAARVDPAMPDYMREYGEIWTTSPKILLSRTRTSADHNTRIIGGESAIQELAEIRATTEGDIGVGGATVATQLLHANLLDEIWLFTHPVILGTGRPLFDSVDRPVHLELLEQATYEQGVTFHRYEVQAAGRPR